MMPLPAQPLPSDVLLPSLLLLLPLLLLLRVDFLQPAAWLLSETPPALN